MFHFILHIPNFVPLSLPRYKGSNYVRPRHAASPPSPASSISSRNLWHNFVHICSILFCAVQIFFRHPFHDTTVQIWGTCSPPFHVIFHIIKICHNFVHIWFIILFCPIQILLPSLWRYKGTNLRDVRHPFPSSVKNFQSQIVA